MELNGQHSDNYNVQHRRKTTAGAPLSSPTSFFDGSNQHSSFSTTSSEDGEIENMKKLNGRKSSSFAHRLRDHVTMGPKFSKTVKGKIRLGAKIIQKGGRENIFKEVFGEIDGEKLLKASQCYLSTTNGPIAGLLFISTQKVAFCSDRSIPLSSPSGDLIRKPYKASIPTNKIKEVNEGENMENPTQKYIQIVTNDGFEFWFMGFLRFEKAFQNLKKAVAFGAK